MEYSTFDTVGPLPAERLLAASAVPGLDVPEPGRLELRPINGVRYAAGRDLDHVTSPPYDVVDRRALHDLSVADPHNVVRLNLPPDDPAQRGSWYPQAARRLLDWLADGVLTVDPVPALYVYEERDRPTAGEPVGRVLQRGVIGGLALSRASAGVVLPHEDVLAGPVMDRLELMAATEANLEPIFLLYDGAAGATSRLVDRVAESRPPLAAATTDDGARHTVWAVTDAAELSAVAADLSVRDALIADGHHRYATYLLLQQRYHVAGRGAGPWDYGLALLVDSTAYAPRLDPIHRVLPGLDLADAAAALRGVFRVRELPDPGSARRELAGAARAGAAFVLAGSGRFLLADRGDDAVLRSAMPSGRSPRWCALVTAVLHCYVIPHAWGIDEDEDSVRVVHDDADAAVAQADAADGTAVILPPLRVSDVYALAAEGQTVPRKSTSFGPKPRTGMVMRTFAGHQGGTGAPGGRT